MGSNPILSAKKKRTLFVSFFYESKGFEQERCKKTARRAVFPATGLRRSAGRIPSSPPKNKLVHPDGLVFYLSWDSNRSGVRKQPGGLS